ncbi:hypothetical protein HD806DRAFT_148422 [Xylariaceae sp. AK1471]|nr:hypothetical protein HD806DRAFT_148422 [Xylariaceae sp. AK1471]
MSVASRELSIGALFLYALIIQISLDTSSDSLHDCSHFVLICTCRPLFGNELHRSHSQHFTLPLLLAKTINGIPSLLMSNYIFLRLS